MFAIGTQIGKYTLRRKLGQGGFGAVYAAYDESLEREVALKILNAEHKTSDDVIRRFLQEARLAARIAHPGIVTVFECVHVSGTNTELDGMAYIAMELLEGESLADRLRRCGPMSVPTAVEVARQIASALEAAHANKIIHRDLKPDNIFLVRDSAALHGERVKVLDFGIAKLHRASSDVHTQTNEIFGTPRYMSPEQCRSSTQIDQRSDIYTLGCILFELLTGRPPFIGPTGELFAQHLMIPAPSVQSIARETPLHVAKLVTRMLEKDGNARPQTMAEVQRALGGSEIAPTVVGVVDKRALRRVPEGETDSTLRSAASMPMRRAPQSTPIVAYLIAGGIALLLAATIVFWLRPDRSAPEPEPVAAAVTPEAVKPAPVVTPPPQPAVEQPTPPPVEEPAEPAKPAKKRGTKAKVEAKRVPEKIVNPFDEATGPITGTLSLRSTPTCEILVDGKAIAASTPKEIELAPGKHRITLVHDQLDIKDSFNVEIRAGAVQKMSRDLRDQVKAKQRNSTINPFGGN